MQTTLLAPPLPLPVYRENMTAFMLGCYEQFGQADSSYVRLIRAGKNPRLA